MLINNICLETLSNGNTDKTLGKLAAKVALENFDYRYATLLFFNTSVYYGVEIFLRVFNYNVIINEGEINSKLAKVINQYVIFGHDFAEFKQMIETLSMLEVRNTGKFIVICRSQDITKCDEMKLNKLFWDNKIVDIVLIKSKEQQAVGFTYFPISDGICHNIRPIELSSNNYSYHISSGRSVFGMKLKKLSFCPLYVSTFLQNPYMYITNGYTEGADGDLLRIIAQGLNTTLKVMTPHRGSGWGYRQSDGVWMGSLGDIHDGLANISMTSAALTLTRFSDFQMSISYYTSHVVWITHPAILQNEALKLLHPFERSSRIALVVSYLLIILCVLIIRAYLGSSMCGNTPEKQPLRSVVFYSWMIFTGQSVLKLPTKSFLLHLTFLWIIYSFIIRTMYQVYLISSLKGTFYEDQFETIDDAIKANYPFGGGPALKDYYIGYPAVYNNWVNIDSTDMLSLILDISMGKKFVLAMNWDTAKYIIKNRKINLHILPQRIVTSPAVIFFKKYSPLAESLNLVLGRLVPAGFPEKLHTDYTTFKTSNLNENEQEALKIVHLTACYVLLMIGWLLSAIFFILEVYFAKKFRRPHIQN